MKSIISKYTHKPTNGKFKISLFSATKILALTGKDSLSATPFQNAQTEKVLQLIELISKGWQSDLMPENKWGNPEERHKEQMAYLDQLKNFALLGVPAAVRFHFEFLSHYVERRDDFHTQLLSNAKEIGLYRRDPSLLMSIFDHRLNKKPYLDLAEAFFCLKAAASMKGKDATMAIYFLASMYAKEAIKLQHPDKPSTSLLVWLEQMIDELKEKGAINEENANKNLRVLEQLGYQLNEPIEPIKIDRENFIKEQFSIYFKLAWNDAIETGVIIFKDDDHIMYFSDDAVDRNDLMNLDALIKAKIETESGDTNFPGSQIRYQYYYDEIKKLAMDGKIGAMSSLIFLEQCKASPDDQAYEEYKEKVAKFYPQYDQIEEMYRAKMQLVIEELKNNNASGALEHFRNPITLHHSFTAPVREQNRMIHYHQMQLLEDIEEGVALNTLQKIDCYFELCSDILMDLPNLLRFECCEFISSMLKSLFQFSYKPDPVSKWLMINTATISLKRKESYFPLFTREDIQVTMRSLASAMKQKLLEKKYLSAEVFDNIKTAPSSLEDAANQLIEAFLLPWNAKFQHQSPDKVWIRQKQVEQLDQLKELALAGVPAAIQFYRGLFRIKINVNNNQKLHLWLGYTGGYQCDMSEYKCDLNKTWSPDNLNALCSHEILLQAKDIALQIKDPYLLICLYTIKTHYAAPFLDLEDAFFCLQEAAKMDGISAANAAYCLANYYGSELVEKDANSYLSALSRHVLTLHTKHFICEEKAKNHLRALSDVGSALAKSCLTMLEHNKGLSLSDSAVLHLTSHPSRIMNVNYLKRQFYHYFNLALQKSMEVGFFTCHAPFTRYANKKFSVTFMDLINWKRQIESIYDKQPPHNNDMRDYYDMFYAQAKEGKVGAMLAQIYSAQNRQEKPDWDLLRDFLNQLNPLSQPNKQLIIAHAARELAAHYEKHAHEQLEAAKEYAVQLGCIHTAAAIAINKFEHHPEIALIYFKKITANAHLHENENDLLNKKIFVLNELLKNEGVALNTAEKIDCYFQMCTDILMNLTHPERLSCCKIISKALKCLFPNDSNRPEEVKKWIELNAEEFSTLRFKEFAPLFTRADIAQTMHILTDAAKEQINALTRRHCLR